MMCFYVAPRFLPVFFQTIYYIISEMLPRVFLIEAVSLIFLLFPNACSNNSNLGLLSAALYSAIIRMSSKHSNLAAPSPEI